MFEKEADYRKARKESKDRITKVIKVWSAEEETIHDEGFQKGSEFGYNKANEWHYVKDEDLPKDFGYYLVALKSVAYKCFVFEVAYFTGNIFTKDGEVLDNAFAWKEIVLPKESE